MMVTPGSSVAGYRIKKTLGLVRGNTIRARHIGRDITAVFREALRAAHARSVELARDSAAS